MGKDTKTKRVENSREYRDRKQNDKKMKKRLQYFSDYVPPPFSKKGDIVIRCGTSPSHPFLKAATELEQNKTSITLWKVC